MVLLEIKELEKEYAGGGGLHGVNMSVESGKIVGLLGPNGSGKTTLLKTIAGLMTPDRGDIIYPNHVQSKIEIKKMISFLPDFMSLPKWMRVKDAFAYYEDMFPDYAPQKAEYMMRLLELQGDKLIHKLSKGMQERVALGLTFSRKAPIYLLDEPLGGIDPVGKMKVLESILSMDLENSTIVLSTHLVKDVETIFDSFYFLSDGRIIQHGESEQLREESGKTIEQLYLEVFYRAQTI